jgi:hypothetical protein
MGACHDSSRRDDFCRTTPSQGRPQAATSVKQVRKNLLGEEDFYATSF